MAFQGLGSPGHDAEATEPGSGFLHREDVGLCSPAALGYTRSRSCKYSSAEEVATPHDGIRSVENRPLEGTYP